jgi:hypothetical protein
MREFEQPWTTELSKKDRPTETPLAHFIDFIGGDDRDRTDGLSLAKAALSQLSYIPKVPFV